ncbi:hypothetical protein P886_1235 [Alteromonadaceae bacterium 2753L.S.0a.02]|nr:hypothetical protein P886_1235 [Alteromonadaceae bacterium 2753L.S.0a.02]
MIRRKPKGPDFSSASSITTNIDGTSIGIRLPKHSKYRGSGKALQPAPNIKETDLLFRTYFEDSHAERGLQDHWQEADFLYRSWAFCGPLFTGVVATLNLSFRIVKVINYPQDISLFHPRALETVIGDYLTYMYSHLIDFTRGDIQDYIAPVNWTPLNTLPVCSVKFDVLPQIKRGAYTEKHYVFFPLANNLMARLLFHPSSIRAANNEKGSLEVDKKPIGELTDNIVASIQLNLSPAAQTQQDVALEGLPDASLIENYPPLKWDKVSEAEKLKILAAQS